LASEYANAGKPAIFLEQDVDVQIGGRRDRWFAAYGSGTAYLPLVMVESGHQISSGLNTGYETTYRRLVETEFLRPPQAEIEAYARQVGLRMRIYARVVNNAGTALSTAANDATLQALVWEDANTGLTGHSVRAGPLVGISQELAPASEFTATLETTYLPSVNWDALHTVVFVDYRPGPGPAYDMLQAALAAPCALAAEPPGITVALEANDRGDRVVPVRLRGPYVLNWTAVADVPWITVSPDAGPVATQPAVIVAARQVSPGWQHGVVTFTASSDDGMSLAQTVPVTAFSGPRVLRVGTATASLGSPAALSVGLSALGDERVVSFSVAFDPAVLTNPTVTLGADAGSATLTTDDSRVADGRLGVSLALPAGQTLEQGDADLVVISFDAVGGAPPVTVPVTLGDQPVPRAIAGTSGESLRATYLDGAVVLTDADTVRSPRRRLAPGDR
jgi:hypothetical protein